MNRRAIATSSCVLVSLSAAVSCNESPDDHSDYSLYSAAVQALADSTAADRILIRRVAGIDQYSDMVYDPRDAHIIADMAPLANPELWVVGGDRIGERPILADSFDLTVDHAFLTDSASDALSSLPFFDAIALSDSLFGAGTVIVCLTPPARIDDQGLVFNRPRLLGAKCIGRKALPPNNTKAASGP